MSRLIFASLCLLAVAHSAFAQERKTREELVRGDKDVVESIDLWIYNDLEAGLKEAKQTGKPLLVTFRCIPCEHCAKLDEEVVEQSPLVRDLLDQFVCVRIVHANGLDLSLFQYDYDQSWAVFMMNADKTIYGRYGTRSHQRESHNDMSLPGFAKALEASLALHREYPKNKDALAAKRGPKTNYTVPEEMPSLKGKYDSELNYKDNVVQSCIHCHQVIQAQRLHYRQRREPIPEKLMYPYPHPKSLGLIMDPEERATVKRVTADSIAAERGFRTGDEIISMEGQPIVSMADMQWVLHNTGKTATIEFEVERNGRTLKIPVELEEGWRRLDDISWRVSSWEFRRIALGGLRLTEASADQRRRLGLSDSDLALLVDHVGQYGAHATAKRAGFRKGDVIVSFDGQSEEMSEAELFAYVLNNKRTGQRMPVVVQRDNRRVELTLPVQD